MPQGNYFFCPFITTAINVANAIINVSVSNIDIGFTPHTKDRKIEIPNLYMLKKGDEENRLRGGSSFEQDNESENFAIYEQELLIDVGGLNDNDIIKILKSKESTVSWTDSNNNLMEFKYNIGEIIEIADSLNL